MDGLSKLTKNQPYKKETMPGHSKRKGEPKAYGLGRPTLLTPKLHKQIIEAVELLGMLESRAAEAYGISPSCITRWKTRGKAAIAEWDKLTPEKQAEERRYADFFNALREAEPKYEMANLTIIQHAAIKGDWRAADRRLAIKFPDRYGRKLQVGGDPQNPLPVPVANVKAPAIYIPDNGRDPGLKKEKVSGRPAGLDK